MIADYYRCTVISLSRYTYYHDRRLAIDHRSLDRAPSIATKPTNPFSNTYTLLAEGGAHLRRRVFAKRTKRKQDGEEHSVRVRSMLGSINPLLDKSYSLNKLVVRLFIWVFKGNVELECRFYLRFLNLKIFCLVAGDQYRRNKFWSVIGTIWKVRFISRK